MQKGLVAMLALVSAITPLPGCKQQAGDQKAPAAGSAAAVASGDAAGATSEEAKDDELAKKVSEYIYCMNHTSKAVITSRSTYLSWANEKTGPTGKESN